MGLNQVLMKFIALPPAVKMLLAVAGFGSLPAILFFVLPALRDKQAKYWLIGIFVVGLIIFGIIWGVRRLMGRKKAGALSGALASQGPTRGDEAEQQQIYREKFRAKLADLKSNGLSVYKLPWFVLMGEPGSGKTATLINSGLDFPLGKDEVPGFGGTRNYNWWFTNQAVILDTAGRIAFQEEGTTDKIEWEYFCKLLKQNRPRCPVNGLIVAIPADKLLRDSAEEREKKATILRERLRQVHQLLGVRFPTFVVVTKMDLVGGFNEFFEEIRVDLQQRNQMVGWSRPDEFQSTYDPSKFPEAFDSVYHRIRDWSMRYLQRKATDEELGMIVTFPEAFRQIRQPLYDYIATIFQKSPLLEPPFFRGFYFTSAVQEGAPIFDVFAKSRIGTAIEGRSRSVDSKAFFIHDLYDKKIFPEHGLVFRSAKHVTLNKRMRRMVWYGSAVMGVAMLGLFMFGCLNFRELVTNPKDDCAHAAEVITAVENGDKPELIPKFPQLSESLKTAQKLEGHLAKYGGFLNWVAARAMFIGANPSIPEGYIRKIHAKYVLETIFRPTVEEFAARISLNPPTLPKPNAPDERKKYLAALAKYAEWFGESAGQFDLKRMTPENAAKRAADFEVFLAALEVPTAEGQEMVKQLRRALESLSDERVFARDIAAAHAPSLQNPKVLNTALNEITQHWMPRTKFDEKNADPRVQYWVGFARVMQQARQSYVNLLGLEKDFKTDFGGASTKFLAQTNGVETIGGPDIPPSDSAFVVAWFDVRKFFETNKDVLPQQNARILRLKDLLQVFQSAWDSEFAKIEDSLKIGAPADNARAASVVWQTLTTSRAALKKSFDASMTDLRTALGISGEVDPLDYYTSQRLLNVKEAALEGGAEFKGPPSIEIASTAFGREGWLKNLLAELRVLAGGAAAEAAALDDFSSWPDLITRMKADDPGDATAKLAGAWSKSIKSDLQGDALRQAVEKNSGVEGQSYWQPFELFGAVRTVAEGNRQLRVGRILDEMGKRCDAATNARELPGLAQLRKKEYRVENPDMPFDRHSFNQSDPARETATPTPAPVKPEPAAKPQSDDLLRPSAPVELDRGKSPTADLRSTTAALLVKYHERGFLAETLRQYMSVQKALQSLGSGVPAADELSKRLRTCAERYVDGYFKDWNDVYTDYRKLLDAKTLDLLKKCRDGAIQWPEFQAEIAGVGGAAISEAFTRRAGALIHHTARALIDEFKVGDLVDDQIYKTLILDRLNVLNKNGQSLPHKLSGIQKITVSAAGGPAERGVTDQIFKAWDAYVKEVKAVGPLTDDKSPPSAKTPPNVAKLQEDLLLPAVTTADFAFYPPLVDLAACGKQLLTQHLEKKLAGLFAESNGKYPVIGAEAVRDDSFDLAKLRAVPTLDRTKFIELLKSVQSFRTIYGPLYMSTMDKPLGHDSIDAAVEWITFLYDKSDPFKSTELAPIGVRPVFDQENKPQGTVNMGSIYREVRVSLPLLNAGTREVAPEIKLRIFNTATGQPAASGDFPNGWLLLPDLSYRKTTATAADVSSEGQAQGFTAESKAWELDANPWSLLLLLASRSNEYKDRVWRIPVVVRGNPGNQKGEARGIFIRIEFERPFPGLIPPLPKPERSPNYDPAKKYFIAAGG